jgi:hypothetical protein
MIMPERNSEIKQLFNDMLSNFLEWDGVYQLDSIDRALIKTEANSLYKISKNIDKNLRSRFIVTAKGSDLDIIGEGMNRLRLPGESDDDYRKRLIVNDTFFNDSTVQGLKNAIRGYYGIDVDNDGENDTKIVELYKEALRGGDIYTQDTKFLGEEVKEGAIAVHLLMVQEGSEVIITRNELFEKIYQTRAAGILLYLFWHGTYNDNLRKKILDNKSLIGITNAMQLGNSYGKILINDSKSGMPILKRSDSLNKKVIDVVSKGTMTSRRVHRLIDGEKFNLPKDFTTPLKVGQRDTLILWNLDDFDKEIMRIESVNENAIRIKIENGTINGFKVILQTAPNEYNGNDLIYFGDEVLIDYLLEGKWYNIKEDILKEDADIQLLNSSLDGYYISPPILIDNLTKFGMVKWVYTVDNAILQFRSGETEESLNNMGNNENWGIEYTNHIGEFIQESSNEFFQFKVKLTGNGGESSIFKLDELFIEYWNVPLNETEEIYDNIENGNDLINLMSNSVIGSVLLMPNNLRGNGASEPSLNLNNTYWITNRRPIRQSKIRNRRWTLYYGVKRIRTDYLTRVSEFIEYERNDSDSEVDINVYNGVFYLI